MYPSEISPEYLISNYGDIYSLKNHKHVKPFVNGENSKYKRVSLRTKSGKHKKFYVHRLVGYNFIYNEDPDKLIEINHIDGVKFNNFYINLEWATKSRNIKHAYKTGLLTSTIAQAKKVYGEEHYSCVFNESIVHECCKFIEDKRDNKYIKKSVDFGKATDGQINSLLYHLRNRHSWHHITKLYKY